MPEEKSSAGKEPRGAVSTGAVVAATGKAGAVSAATARDHEAITRLADDLLPALIAKLTASNLGEIEVRQGGSKARLRKPAGADATRRAARAAEGLGQGRGSSVAMGGRSADEARRAREEQRSAPEEPTFAAAISPAVGIFQPMKDLTVGMRVRSGDRIGTVNVLGVKEDVTAPIDGIIGSSLVEAGEAVEYGQELVRVELPDQAAAQTAVAQTIGSRGIV